MLNCIFPAGKRQLRSDAEGSAGPRPRQAGGRGAGTGSPRHRITLHAGILAAGGRERGKQTKKLKKKNRISRNQGEPEPSESCVAFRNLNVRCGARSFCGVKFPTPFTAGKTALTKALRMFRGERKKNKIKKKNKRGRKKKREDSLAQRKGAGTSLPYGGSRESPCQPPKSRRRPAFLPQTIKSSPGHRNLNELSYSHDYSISFPPEASKTEKSFQFTDITYKFVDPGLACPPTNLPRW